MRVRNKELRERRHRKEQRVKELIKVAKVEAKSGGKVKGQKPVAPVKKVEPKPEVVTSAVEAPVEKPKKAPKKKVAAPAE